MGGPIAHGVTAALRKERDAGGPTGRPEPPRWRLWLYIAGSLLILGFLVYAWQTC
jgi:hypothetical protein